MVTVKGFSKSGYCNIGHSHRACCKSLKLFSSYSLYLNKASFFNKFDKSFSLAEKSLMNLL